MARNKRIEVYLGRRVLCAREGDKVFLECPCLIGREGHQTDPGSFTVFRKNHPYRSKKYDAPMDYAMFFSADGKAIHQSKHFLLRNLGMGVGINAAGSHGCVGLSESNASKLYEWTPMGTRVVILA